MSSLLLPTGGVPFDPEALAATARKELVWRRMVQGDQRAFQEAAERHWQIWLDHNAVQLPSKDESEKLEVELAQRGLKDIVLQPRWLLTDKNDGKRSESSPLPLLAGV